MSLSDNNLFNNNKYGETHSLPTPEIWRNAINTLLTALENIFLDENGMPLGAKDSDSVMGLILRSRRLSASNPIAEERPYVNFSPLKRKQREEENQRKIKFQRRFNSLSLQLARSLSLDDPQYEEPLIKTQTSMDFNFNTSSSFSHPLGSLPYAQRAFKPYPRQLNNRVAKSAISTDLIDVDMEDIASESLEDPDETTFDISLGFPTQTTRNKMFQRVVSHIETENWPVPLKKWYESQAQRRNLSIQEFEREFDQRSRELEIDLNLVHAHSQDYNQILTAIDRFLINADWLRNDYIKPLMTIFPNWNNLSRNLENVIQFIDIVEDMKCSTKTEISPTGDLKSDFDKILKVLQFKRYFYGEILQQSGLTWRARGYPVQESWIADTKRWLFSLAVRCSVMLNNELAKYNESTAVDDQRLAQVMENLMVYLKIAKQTVDLVGAADQGLTLSSIYLATAYVHWALSQMDKLEHKAVRSFEVKMMHICENINQILDHLRAIQDLDSQNWTKPDDIKILEDFAAALVEAGLRLCEHITKPKTSTTVGNESFVFIYSEFVIKFVNKVIEYVGREQETERRIRVLYSSLRNMEVSLPSL